jgi:hypothetical protein
VLIGRMLAKLMRGSVHAGFKRWVEAAKEGKRVRALLTRAASKLLKVGKQAAWVQVGAWPGRHERRSS